MDLQLDHPFPTKEDQLGSTQAPRGWSTQVSMQRFQPLVQPHGAKEMGGRVIVATRWLDPKSFKVVSIHERTDATSCNLGEFSYNRNCSHISCSIQDQTFPSSCGDDDLENSGSHSYVIKAIPCLEDIRNFDSCECKYFQRFASQQDMICKCRGSHEAKSPKNRHRHRLNSTNGVRTWTFVTIKKIDTFLHISLQQPWLLTTTFSHLRPNGTYFA